jgi:isoleucyl-tRNA synthetase
VHSVEFMHAAEELVTFSAKPNFKSIGKVHGSNTQAAAAAIRALPSDLLAAFRRGEEVFFSYVRSADTEPVTFPLTETDFDLQQSAQGDYAIESEAGFTIALDPTLTPELRLEGLARELVNRVQNLRKETGLEVQDRIRLGVFGDGEILDVTAAWGETVADETLAIELETGSLTDFEGYEASREVDLDGVTGTIALARVR